MFKANSIFPVLLIINLMFFFNSCEQLTEPIMAHSRNLSAIEIMNSEGISSIHYIEYDSVVVNGIPTREFTLSFEYYIDTLHYKIIQYNLDNQNFNTTVYDLRKNIAWNFYSSKLTYLDLPNLPEAYEIDVKAALGSWLRDHIKYLGTATINEKLCDVFEDSTGYKEWIWKKYKLPIQRRRNSQYDNLYQITVTQKRDITINHKFPDITFEPPK